MRTSPIIYTLASVSLASADVLNIIVGANFTDTFTPSSVVAKVGDIITFQFTTNNHTVSQSSFDNPCQPLAGGVTSPFFNVKPTDKSIPEWLFVVDNASAPLWFYCAQKNHCTEGMVFAVNPTADKTFSTFHDNAMGIPSPSPSPTPNSGSRESRHTAAIFLSALSIGFLFF